jgi:hypothetical protein
MMVAIFNGLDFTFWNFLLFFKYKKVVITMDKTLVD